MVFTSAAYGLLVTCAFVAYWTCRRRRAQLGILLAASCIFYGWWSVQYLFLMLGLSALGYIGGLCLEPGRPYRRLTLLGLILLLLATLTYYKYAAFLCDSLNSLLSWLTIPPFAPVGLSITLPLAISFHVFQLIAYLVDVYAGRHRAEHDVLAFFTFSFFFPQLVAGPIERATELLGQLKRPPLVMTYQQMQQGIELVVYGFFLKVVLADPIGLMVDSVFVVNQHSGLSVVLGTMLFALQIYCDFYGYSLIAQGTAALFSIELSTNFRNPYWAVSPSDFWRRWHITLSTWIRDYVYIPLGGNSGSVVRVSFTLLITMALAGLWHGASWNFVLWGVWHGLVILAGRAIALLPGSSRVWPQRALSIPLTFFGVFVGWYLFRASSLDVLHATARALGSWHALPVHDAQLRALLCSWTILLSLEYCQQTRNALTPFAAVRPALRPCFIGGLLFLIIAMWSPTPVSFIYFQF